MWNSAPLTAVAALLLDLATKSLALSWLAEPPHTVPVLPVFSFTLGFNSGNQFRPTGGWFECSSVGSLSGRHFNSRNTRMVDDPEQRSRRAYRLRAHHWRRSR